MIVACSRAVCSVRRLEQRHQSERWKKAGLRGACVDTRTEHPHNRKPKPGTRRRRCSLIDMSFGGEVPRLYSSTSSAASSARVESRRIPTDIRRRGKLRRDIASRGFLVAIVPTALSDGSACRRVSSRRSDSTPCRWRVSSCHAGHSLRSPCRVEIRAHCL